MKRNRGSDKRKKELAFVSSLLYLMGMSFVSLQDSLRRELRKRIEAGELTGMELARRTGFTQAHVSNFLNRKRGLKLAALDRMLKAIGLRLYDLLDPHELLKVTAVPAGKEEEYVDVPLVEGAIAAGSEVIVNEEVKELLKFRRAFLSRVRGESAAVPGKSRQESGATPRRKDWTRFVLIKVDQKEGLSMWPRVGPGATTHAAASAATSIRAGAPDPGSQAPDARSAWVRPGP